MPASPPGRITSRPDVVGGPAVLEQDRVVLADEVAHRARLATLQAGALGDDVAVLVAHDDVELRWGGVE